MMAERRGISLRNVGIAHGKSFVEIIADFTLRRDRWNTVQHTTSGMHHHLCSDAVERG